MESKVSLFILYMRYNIIKNFVLMGYKYIMLKIQYRIIRPLNNILLNHFYYSCLISPIKNRPIIKAIVKTLKKYIFITSWPFHFLNVPNILAIVGSYYSRYNKTETKILFAFANLLLH